MHAPSEFSFLSCDWGTSSFRLRFVSEGSVLEEYRDETGCKLLFEQNSPADRPAAFEAHLRSAVARLTRACDPLPLVISGMASSTIGWRELPYAKLPLNLDGSNLHLKQIQWSAPSSILSTYLVSGAASESDMMRGEETEAIGLMQLVSSKPPNLLLILPGTHSKHLTIQRDAITAIQTYMTGELYEVLARYSVLRASVAPTAELSLSSFSDGVEYVRTNGLPASLFQTRTRQVLQGHPAETNAAFLSGLVIGAELLSIAQTEGAPPIFLGGSGAVRPLYAQTANVLKLPLAHVFSDAETQQAVPRAHQLILSRMPQ